MGKSTLEDQLTRKYRADGQRVAIVAVDPSSPFSGGAILGDRIRMQSLTTDPNVFIRSMATRGKMGGLSRAVNESLMVLDAAGYRLLIVETIGVGQDEVDIAKTAHLTVVVVSPGMGDDIQTIKAVPDLIRIISEKGYSFIPLNDYITKNFFSHKFFILTCYSK